MFADTNAALSEFGKISIEELQKRSWDKGVVGRAYYVTGAYLCNEIDEKEGRERLIEVYSKGPISIIELYNAIADDELKVSLPV
jgi:hypothetical protein